MILDMIGYSNSIELDSICDTNVLMCHLEANEFIMMIRYDVFQLRNTRLTYNDEYDLWEAYLYICWCVTNRQYYRLVSNGYICHELVFDVRGAVGYDYSGLHEIGIRSSL